MQLETYLHTNPALTSTSLPISPQAVCCKTIVCIFFIFYYSNGLCMLSSAVLKYTILIFSACSAVKVNHDSYKNLCCTVESFMTLHECMNAVHSYRAACKSWGSWDGNTQSCKQCGKSVCVRSPSPPPPPSRPLCTCVSLPFQLARVRNLESGLVYSLSTIHNNYCSPLYFLQQI